MEVGAHPPWFWNAFDPTQIAQLAVSLRLLNRWILFEDTNETHPGRVAEWLGRALQKLLQRFESALDLHYQSPFLIRNLLPTQQVFTPPPFKRLLVASRDFLQRLPYS